MLTALPTGTFTLAEAAERWIAMIEAPETKATQEEKSALISRIRQATGKTIGTQYGVGGITLTPTTLLCFADATNANQAHYARLKKGAKMTILSDYAVEIAKRVRRLPPTNYLIAGISPFGKLMMDEACDSGTRFRPEDVVEQASFRGQTTALAIERQLAAREP